MGRGKRPRKWKMTNFRMTKAGVQRPTTNVQRPTFKGGMEETTDGDGGRFYKRQRREQRIQGSGRKVMSPLPWLCFLPKNDQKGPQGGTCPSNDGSRRYTRCSQGEGGISTLHIERFIYSVAADKEFCEKIGTVTPSLSRGLCPITEGRDASLALGMTRCFSRPVGYESS